MSKNPIDDWSTVPTEIKEKARELCAADGIDPDAWSEDGYGSGWSEDGNHTATYAEAEPLWFSYVEDAVAALTRMDGT